MKVNNHRRAKMSKRSAAIIALAAALVITIFVGYVGMNGMWLDNRGLYKLMPWVPKAHVTKETWPKPIALGLDLQGGVFVEYEATMSDDLKNDGYDFNKLLDNSAAELITAHSDQITRDGCKNNTAHSRIAGLDDLLDDVIPKLVFRQRNYILLHLLENLLLLIFPSTDELLLDLKRCILILALPDLVYIKANH